MNDKPHLDVEALAELQDVMEHEFDLLIQTYLADSTTRLDALKTALEEKDADQFAKTAHSLKGSCINMGAPRLGGFCFEAEQLGKSGDLGGAGEVLARIDAEFEEVARRLRHFGADA
ncbi:histidine kinase [Marinobacter fuscus]|uniref:Histidine kinase n=1 Tax=Marinobacter fuscus TaxID=2109942 RepID=A0A2T1K7Q8_9GAMM|nr:Hpt domain-containing protein [Marinobacter fuscus]PSF06184.1 histidine kinase [Marinobacter fuscus]